MPRQTQTSVGGRRPRYNLISIILGIVFMAGAAASCQTRTNPGAGPGAAPDERVPPPDARGGASIPPTTETESESVGTIPYTVSPSPDGDALVGITEQFPELAFALQRFDAGTTPSS